MKHWCAGLQQRRTSIVAVRDGDEFVINGANVDRHAHEAEWLIFDPHRHRSARAQGPHDVLPMSTPGITVERYTRWACRTNATFWCGNPAVLSEINGGWPDGIALAFERGVRVHQRRRAPAASLRWAASRRRRRRAADRRPLVRERSPSTKRGRQVAHPASGGSRPSACPASKVR